MSSTAILVSGRAKEGQRDAIYALYREHVVPHVATNEDVREGSNHRELFGSPWFRAYIEHAAPLAAEPAAARLLTTRWLKGVE